VDLGAPMLDLLERLNQAQPGTAFTQQALDACRAGALGKPSSDRDAEKTLRLSGQVLGQDVSTSETAPAPDMTLQPLKEPLTNRELDILALLALRLQNKEIAEKLFISPATVKTQLQNIYQRLSAKSRRQAVENAEALGILSRH
jgi:LuxR family maltose regulon positive regulatory protein